MIHYDKEWPDDENFKSHTFIESVFSRWCTACKVMVISRAINGGICWYYILTGSFEKYQIDSNNLVPTCKQVIAANKMHEALE